MDECEQLGEFAGVGEVRLGMAGLLSGLSL
jgi:hypothetical protein